MDILTKFLLNREGKLNLFSLLQSRSYLMNIQNNNGFITVDDIRLSFLTANYMFSTVEYDFHRALLFESCLIPIVGFDGTVHFKLRDELIKNDVLFTTTLINTVSTRSNHEQLVSIQDFKKSIGIYLSTKKSNNYINNQSTSKQSSIITNDRSSRPNQSYGFTEYPKLYRRNSIEQCEPIVKLLAQVRKQGMDILFPQETHDKVIACIYVALQRTRNPAHRELIDMVMDVKESKKFTKLEFISKTKIRGILALLKHADILHTCGVEGTPVNLLLAPDVTNYETIRDKHDKYMNVFCSEYRISITKELWNEVVWKQDMEYNRNKMMLINEYMRNVEIYLHHKSISISNEITNYTDYVNVKNSLISSQMTQLPGYRASHLNPHSSVYTSSSNSRDELTYTDSSSRSVSITSDIDLESDTREYHPWINKTASFDKTIRENSRNIDKYKDGVNLNPFSIPGVFDNQIRVDSYRNCHHSAEYNSPNRFFNQLFHDKSIILNKICSPNYLHEQSLKNGITSLYHENITSPAKMKSSSDYEFPWKKSLNRNEKVNKELVVSLDDMPFESFHDIKDYDLLSISKLQLQDDYIENMLFSPIYKK